MLSLIVAHDKNFAIGYQGWMPWQLKEDLKIFKSRTINHTIVMGLKTFASLGKPLANRKTIIVCSPKNATYVDENIAYCHDFDKYLKDHENTPEEIFICGGASIYDYAMPYCKKLYITLVDGDHPADTWLKKYDPSNYQILKIEDHDGFKLIEYLKKE